MLIRPLVTGLAVLSFMLGALRAAEHKTLAIGSPLPDFSLPAVDGKTYGPDSFKDAKALVIIFTCNHCPTAQAYEDRIHKLVEDYQGKGAAFLAINPNHADAVRLDEMGYTDLGDTFEEMKIRAEHKHFNYPYADDGPTQAVVEKFGPIATPHVFIFDQSRKLAFNGRIDDSEREATIKHHDTRDALEAVLAGKAPQVTTTKVFGCSLKWKEKADDNHAWRAKVAKEPVTLNPISPSDLKELRANKGTGKVRLINAWATWCGPCVAEFDELIETNLRFRHRDFEMITLAAQFPDEQAKVLNFLKKKQASTTNYLFGSKDKYEMIEALDPEWGGALPYTLLIDADGKILYRESGSIDFLALRRAIVPALNRLTPWPGLSD